VIQLHQVAPQADNVCFGGCGAKQPSGELRAADSPAPRESRPAHVTLTGISRGRARSALGMITVRIP
jgi:hypothetical protein